MTTYQFAERLKWSEGFLQEGIELALVSRIPNCIRIEKAAQADDRNGTDYWAHRDNGLRPLSIDVKVRAVDFAPKGHDDLALETWSKLNERVGWTRDANKHSDYILWFWQDTKRFFLVPFPPLCKTFQRYWTRWRDKYKVDVQTSDSWQSECVFVPRKVVLDRLCAWSSGTIELEQHV